MVTATSASDSHARTQALGEKLGRALAAGDTVALVGELGAGKTAFVQGMARGLGVTGAVKSPSFTIVNEHDGRVPLFHVDLSTTMPSIGATTRIFSAFVSACFQAFIARSR